MKENMCLQCGNIFLAKSLRHKLCSEECVKARYKITHRLWRKNNYKRDAKMNKLWRKNNKEKHNASNALWRKRHPEQIKKYGKKHRTEEHDKVLEQHKKCIAKNPEKERARIRLWSKNNKEKRALSTHIRRVRQGGNDGIKVSYENFKTRLQEFAECIFCGSKDRLTVEHLIPVSKGGTNAIENIFVSCLRCNISKQAREWKVWYRKQTFYDKKRERLIIKLSA